MDPITIDGLTFPAAIELSGRWKSGHRVFRQRTRDGEPLYAIPGGEYVTARELPAIAAKLKSRCVREPAR